MHGYQLDMNRGREHHIWQSPISGDMRGWGEGEAPRRTLYARKYIYT